MLSFSVVFLRLLNPPKSVVKRTNMRFRPAIQSLMVVASLLILSTASHAQSHNFLQNPDAEQSATRWQAFGEATVEATTAGGFCFVVWNGGYFFRTSRCRLTLRDSMRC